MAREDSVEIKKRTIVIGLFFIVIFLAGFFAGQHITGCVIGLSGVKTISSSEAVQRIQSFLDNNMPGVELAVKEKVESSGMYKISGVLNLNGMTQEVVLYVTKDGEFLFPDAIPLGETGKVSRPEQSEAQSVPKSDKPKVELFVMSHCPFGVQAEKGILPVVELLGDKIDFSVKFVYYAMHGKEEIDEEMRQVCIQKEEAEKYLDYLYCFLEDGNSDRCMSELDIDQSELNKCLKELDEEYNITELYENESSWLNGRYPQFNVHREENEKYGVSGSPTLVINGVTVRSSRDPASFLATICSSFNDVPEECENTLSSEVPSPGFGYGTGSDTQASCN